MVEPAKIAIIINLEALKDVKQLRTMLGHTRYYRRFIKPYSQVIAPMEKLLKKDASFFWDKDCQKTLDVLEEKMVAMPILVFPNRKKEFHIHVDASCIVLGVVLTQLGEGDIVHPIEFTGRKLLKVEKNYSSIERKGLEMVYVL